MLGTMISVLSISFLGIGASTTSTTTSSALLLLPSPSSSIHALWQALSSALLMNVCIVGINQIYDIEIDKINKPYLPLASGQMTVFTAVAIVLITGAASLGIGVVSGSGPLLVTLVGSLLLGIAYSVDIPLLRWKQYPVVAAACILAVRALLVQLGFFQHMVNAMRSGTSGGSSGGSEGGLLQWFINPLSYLIPTLSNSNITPTIYQAALSTPTIQFATGFMLIFSIVIALFKDIPDVRGDAKAGIQTLSVRWGTTNIYWACIILLEFVYGWAIVFGMLRGKVLASVAHAVLAAVLWWRGGKTDLDDKESIHDCYMDSWKLFYIEYLLLPLLN
jgi:homogentisate phytyltransferase / homogentisate geranylgeranyltransferase